MAQTHIEFQRYNTQISPKPIEIMFITLQWVKCNIISAFVHNFWHIKLIFQFITEIRKKN